HKRIVKMRGAVVYIAGEGRAGISKRLKAWEIHNKADLSKAPLYISHKAAALCDDGFMEHVRKSVQAVGARERVALIVVDTWARNMAGDENSTVDTTAAIRAVDDLRALYQCTAIIVHHSGQAESERGRGSSALRAALDVEYKVEIQNDIMLVKNTKMKDGEPPEPMTFAFETVDLGIIDDDGDPVESSVLEEVELEGIVPRKKKRGKVQSAILEALKEAGNPIEKQALKACFPDTRDNSFYSALSSLAESGDIIIDGCMILCTPK
ncbi:MAG TPA: AAA family ATPase, partial [Spirochaetales bacterium]|nr:AAA family ATPase [Spirochaetales bacterium]